MGDTAGGRSESCFARHTRFSERSRDRFVEADELPRLLGAIDAESSPFGRAAFRLYLHTGLRRSEMAGLQWEYVDLERAEIRLPDTKAGRPHVITASATTRAEPEEATPPANPEGDEHQNADSALCPNCGRGRLIYDRALPAPDT